MQRSISFFLKTSRLNRKTILDEMVDGVWAVTYCKLWDELKPASQINTHIFTVVLLHCTWADWFFLCISRQVHIFSKFRVCVTHLNASLKPIHGGLKCYVINLARSSFPLCPYLHLIASFLVPILFFPESSSLSLFTTSRHFSFSWFPFTSFSFSLSGDTFLEICQRKLYKLTPYCIYE